ncbi:hypothetical protein BELL_0399g00070 [Botrytis elliptica]|uniref:Uncharacterized protein n=1 Tax=Botrytis elliptica TaxID=278938 RepID=A0A4Z1JH19_9HELO|nr:hypothetical protein BELL_0399g00070 [Botrytis elliptica]
MQMQMQMKPDNLCVSSLELRNLKETRPDARYPDGSLVLLVQLVPADLDHHRLKSHRDDSPDAKKPDLIDPWPMMPKVKASLGLDRLHRILKEYGRLDYRKV